MVFVPTRVTVVVAILAVLARIRLAVLVGVAVRAVITGRSRDRRGRRPVPVARIGKRGRHADTGDQQHSHSGDSRDG
jgi:hypothetical protein